MAIIVVKTLSSYCVMIEPRRLHFLYLSEASSHCLLLLSRLTCLLCDWHLLCPSVLGHHQPGMICLRLPAAWYLSLRLRILNSGSTWYDLSWQVILKIFSFFIWVRPRCSSVSDTCLNLYFNFIFLYSKAFSSPPCSLRTAWVFAAYHYNHPWDVIRHWHCLPPLALLSS